MRYSSAIFLSILLFTVTGLRAQKKLVIIGSSTSACFNVNSVTECYVGLLDTHYNTQAPNDTTIDNHLTLGGTNCYNGMPSSYTSPYSSPYQPDATRNITMALSLNPDVILVNYPTNGYDVLRVDSILYCLRTIRDSANKKGIPCFVTTTQPRTSPSSFNTSAVKAKLALLKDSILAEFGFFAIDFYTGLINPLDSSILYDSGDQIHMNATGHNILYQRVLAKNIFNIALPATFIQFSAVNKNSSNIISWTTAKETDVAWYEIDRSSDGRTFSQIGAVNASNSNGSNQYQFTDDQPLKGWDYYKIVIVDRDGKKHASPVLSVHINAGKTAIIKTFASSSSQVAVQIQNSAAQTIQLQLVNNMGMLLAGETKKIDAGTAVIYLNTPVLSNGIYHVRLVAADVSTTSSFIKN